MDGFVMRFNTTGHGIWSQQFGGPDQDEAVAIALNAAGAVHIAGLKRSSKTSDVSSYLLKLRQHGF